MQYLQAQKLYAVEILQKLGFVVTILDDGVDDSPAIKIANIDISISYDTTDNG